MEGIINELLIISDDTNVLMHHPLALKYELWPEARSELEENNVTLLNRGHFLIH